MDYNERIGQCNADIARLQDEKARLIKEKERAESPEFHVGDVLNHKSGACSYMLVRTFPKENPSGTPHFELVQITGHDKGIAKHMNVPIQTFKDRDGRMYIKQLPTLFPEDFGLDRKIGYGYKG